MPPITKTHLSLLLATLLVLGYVLICLTSANWVAVYMGRHPPYMEVQPAEPGTYTLTWWGGRDAHMVKAINISTPEGDHLIAVPTPGATLAIRSAGPVTVYGQEWDRGLWIQIGKSGESWRNQSTAAPGAPNPAPSQMP